MGVIAKGILRGCQGLFTPVSLGYPLSVFNKNSTLITVTKIPIPFLKSTQATNTQIHHFNTTVMCQMSIAEASFDSVGSLRTTLLLRTTCMRSCYSWIASCVAANESKTKQTKN